MDNVIHFKKLLNGNGVINCTYEDNIDSGVLTFELTPVIKPRNDLIAIALSTLCGRGNYQRIIFDFEITDKVRKNIEYFCNAIVSAPICNIVSVANYEKNGSTLSFSGGFDSLAAKFLMPEETSLVSMDLGGNFKRERDFFSKFDTHIVKSNLLNTHLRKNSWSFMGIAAILYSDFLNIKYHTFGSILEAGPNNISDNPVAAKNVTFPPFAAVEMINAPYTLGITEIGTAMVLLKSAPELVYASLNSLANNGETKKYRKQLISNLVSHRLNIDFKIEEFDKPNNKWVFGKNFADDFLTFYFLKYSNIEMISKMMVDIPEEIINISNQLKLDFFERINTNFLENFPKPLLSAFLTRASNCGLIPYTQNDWKELMVISNILKKYHKI